MRNDTSVLFHKTLLGHKKTRPNHSAGGISASNPFLPLTRLEAGVLLVDHINAALALDHLAVAVAFFKAFQ
jgi:hypothetical protein